MPTLIELMKDPSVVVRDTTAWTVGRICELLPEAAINDVYLTPLLQCLIEGLSAEPRVASNVCWVRGFLPGEIRILLSPEQGSWRCGREMGLPHWKVFFLNSISFLISSIKMWGRCQLHEPVGAVDSW